MNSLSLHDRVTCTPQNVIIMVAKQKLGLCCMEVKSAEVSRESGVVERDDQLVFRWSCLAEKHRVLNDGFHHSPCPALLSSPQEIQGWV